MKTLDQRATDHSPGWSADTIRTLCVRGLGALLLTIGVLGLGATAEATTIDVRTGNVGKGLARGVADPSVTWNYTGNFASTRFLSYVDNDPVFPGPTTNSTCHFVTGNCRTNNNSQYGPDVPGGFPAYGGVQFFYMTFDLPTGAANVTMDVASAGADDRIGVSLNGNELGFWGNVNGTGLGRMDGSDIYAAPVGPGIEPTRLSGVFFQNPFAFTPFQVSDPGKFIVGGTNVVRLWVNNTGFRSFTNAARPMSSGDPSIAVFVGSVNFDLTTVPEPGTLSLLGLGLAGLGFMRRRLNN